MKELQDQLNLLNQQVANIRNMMRDKLQPYWVDDSHYVNGDITVTISFGYEDYDWTMYCGKDWVDGRSAESFELTLWNILMGIHQFEYQECDEDNWMN